jgi:predicted dinucleotide-binding enzyme
MTERRWIAHTFGDPLAGDDPGAKAVVAALDDAMGSDTVDIGGSAESRRVDRGQPAFIAHQDATQLRANAALAKRRGDS